MRKNETLGRWTERRGGAFVVTLCLLLVAAPIFAGCSPQNMAQTEQATATVATDADATSIPAATGDAASPTAAPATLTADIASATVDAPTQPTADAAVTAAATSTPEPRPLPTGTPPDPLSRLDIFTIVPVIGTLVKRDQINLVDGGADEVLFTVSSPAETITSEATSAIGVMVYDSQYWEWDAIWSSPVISGTASPLLNVNQSGIGGLNGGDLLRTGSPILLARTTMKDGRARLYMWRWDRDKRSASPVRMTPVGGGAEQDAMFEAELDVNLADLNDDGVYEVVADNSAGVQVWKWDGAKYAPEGGQR